MKPILLALFFPIVIQSQTWMVNSFDYSLPLVLGNNVLLPDTSNQIWQVGKSVKFDGILSSKPALYTDTLNSYPENMDESVMMVLYDTLPNSGGLQSFIYDVRFTHRFETDTLLDGAYIEVSLDSGNTWVNALDYTDSIQWPGISGFSADFTSNNYFANGQRIAFSGNGKQMRQNQIWMGLNGAIKTSSGTYDPWEVAPYLRFSFVSDSIETNKAGWQIDEVEIFGGIWGGNSRRIIPVYIMPNPSTGIFEVQSQGRTNENFQVIDINGRVIIQGKLHEGGIRLDLSRYESGVYLLKFENGMAVKLIKQ